MIESYDFGEIIVDGKRYFSDLLIFPKKVLSGWWRKKGHSLCIEDLKDVIKEKPEVIVIGTGYAGLMKVPNDVREQIRNLGIDLIIQRTEEACKTFNKLLKAGKMVVAALHLTC